MLDAFFGEFLISPAPLEMSLNYCSYKCAYCFANLNAPTRTANTKGILSLLQQHQDRHTLVAMLVRHRYPVVISNRVDPFAQSNVKVALPLMEVMVTMGIPVLIQTKGGPGAYDAMDLVPPSVWYISVSYNDDTLRKQIEPGAPSLAERYDLIEALGAAGHRVVVGLNPYFPDWMPNPGAIARRLASLGVWGVWTERLHLNSNQSRLLSDRERAAIGETALTYALKWIGPAEWEPLQPVREAVLAEGLEIYSMTQPNASAFFDVYHETYDRTFPTMQDWVNALHTVGEPALVTFDDFVAFFAPHFPAGEYPRMDSYLGSGAPHMRQEYDIPGRMTYTQLLSFIWRDGRMHANPGRNLSFAFAKVGEMGLVDDWGFPILLFVPEGTHEWWIDLDAEAVA